MEKEDPYRGTPFEVETKIKLRSMDARIGALEDSTMPMKKERWTRFFPPLIAIPLGFVLLLLILKIATSCGGPSLADKQWSACWNACPGTHSRAVNVRSIRVYGSPHAEYYEPGKYPLARCTCLSGEGKQVYRFVTVRK